MKGSRWRLGASGIARASVSCKTMRRAVAAALFLPALLLPALLLPALLLPALLLPERIERDDLAGLGAFVGVLVFGFFVFLFLRLGSGELGRRVRGHRIRHAVRRLELQA